MIQQLEHWWVQSSALVGRDGSRITRSAPDRSAWFSAELPATVLAVLVAHGVYPDPFLGMAFEELPGRGPAHENFSNHPMPEESPFRVPWWFCCNLGDPKAHAERTARHQLPGAQYTWLELDGLNYRANLYVNGALVADQSELVGAYRGFTLLLDPYLVHGENQLGLEVLPPNPDDLAITWVDWNPSPPDKNMGLWRPARLRTTGAVRMHRPQVVSQLPERDFSLAELSVFVPLENASRVAVQGKLELAFGAATLQLDFELGPRERREISVDSAEFPALRLSQPRLWWPRGRGAQPLEQLDLIVRLEGAVSDRRRIEHGIRQVTSELTDQEACLFRINGQPILIRGGGWARDMLLRSNAERELIEYAYVKDLGLNTIRFEGMLESSDFLRRCDRDGVLVIGGFCCCDHWEKWQNWRPEDLQVAEESLRSELARVRNHPSMIAWWYGSDFPPPRHVEERYLAILTEERWPNPAHSSAAAKPTELTGPSGMKMAGPYDYVPPSYWLEDLERGGAFGFASEVSPGPAIPPLETLREMLGEQQLWPPNACWTLHSGGGPFKDRSLFDQALAARYGAPSGIEDYVWKAQLACYEAQRAMFEAFARRKYRATGVIQWMLNNAWPSLIWHLWDHSLRTAGGYFGVKKACEPLHIQYDAGEETISVVSDLPAPSGELRARIRIFDLELRERFHREVSLSAVADGVSAVCELPDRRGFGRTHFLLLELFRAEPEGMRESRVSRNFYWLSSERDVVDYARANWYMAPLEACASFHALAELPPSTIELEQLKPQPQPTTRLVRVRNAGQTLAFFTRLRLLDGARVELPGALYSDNYLCLLPGESADVALTAHEPGRAAGVEALALPSQPGVEGSVWLPL